LGLGNHISFGNKNGSVIGRNTLDIERWKRYRGGKAGKLWIDENGNGNYEELKGINTNYNCPMWIGEHIYFISDHEGIANIYSIKPNGSDLKKHTNHTTYYCKHATTDGATIVYANGADLYQLNVEKGQTVKIDINYNSPKAQNQRKFINGAQYLQDYDIHPEGHSLLVNSRGKAFEMANWEGPVFPIVAKDEVRHRLPRFFHQSDIFVYISDEGGQEEFIEFYDKAKNKTTQLKGLEIGRPNQMKVAPNDKFLALSNHKGQLIIIDIIKKRLQLIDKSNINIIKDFNWSRDSKWLSYASEIKAKSSQIKIYDVSKQKAHQITSGDFIDFEPVFSFCGNYLYFLSNRFFNPVYDSVYFDLNFPRTTKPYCVALNKDAKNPFIPKKKPLHEDDNFTENGNFKKINPSKIDLDGISERIVEMPVKEGNYEMEFFKARRKNNFKGS